jgi:tRNA (guanine-N7-)-methyltransferase
MTNRQREAYGRLYETCGIPFVRERLPLLEIFGRNAPLVLEIGFGMGEATAQIAAQNPQNDYLATEVHPAGIGNLVALVEQGGLSNIRIIAHDALEVLEDNIADSTLLAIHIYFPDPWPKTRHHKRRLIKPETTRLFCQKIKPGGYIHVATDWPDYAEKILKVFESEGNLHNTVTAFAPRPPWRPVTKFEKRAIREGRRSFDVLFTRV